MYVQENLTGKFYQKIKIGGLISGGGRRFLAVTFAGGKNRFDNSNSDKRTEAAIPKLPQEWKLQWVEKTQSLFE